MFEKATQKLAEVMVLGAGDPFANANTLFKSTTAKFVGIGLALSTLIFVIFGIVYMFGGAELKKKAKDKFFDVIIGIVVVFGATTIVGFIVDFVKQSGFQ